MKSTKDIYEEQLQREDDEYNELSRQDDMSWWEQQDNDEQRAESERQGKVAD